MNDITRTISQLEQQRASLDRAIQALRDVEGGKTRAAVRGFGGAPKKRQMSAEGRRRIAEAARKRWAEIRANKAAQSKRAGRKRAGRKSAAKKAAPAASA